MPIRSMTGYAQVRSHAVSADATNPGASFSVSLKSVNHRYLDLSMRMPPELDPLEMKLRKKLKESLVRGHVDVTVSMEKSTGNGLQVNREMVSAYVRAFREAARESSIVGEPDLNAILKMPGAMSTSNGEVNDFVEVAVLTALEKATQKLNEMREEEGRGMERELRRCMASLATATSEVSDLRQAVSKACLDKVNARMTELIAGKADPDRILQEAAMLAERSDVQEEIVRLQTHINHFLGLLDSGDDIGKKLDFLLQEMNREANTLLSKTAGVSGDGLRITEIGLAMKSEIEKAREQVQNIE